MCFLDSRVWIPINSLISIWVRYLDVRINLGFIKRPCLPHNLIWAQRCPVPFSKFPDEPSDFKSPVSHKKELRYSFFFLLKCPTKNTLKFPAGTPMGIVAFYWTFVIYLQIPDKIPPWINKIFPFIKGLRKGGSLHVLQKSGLLWKLTPILRP